MLNIFKNKKNNDNTQNKEEKNKAMFQINSPMTGRLMPLEEVPDQVFSEKILGDGFAIMPTNGSVTSPIEGEVVQVFDTKHAITISNSDGVEVLIHFGIDTVKLEGVGFESFVKAGDKVQVGTKLLEVDIEAIKDKVTSLITPIIFTAPERKFNVVSKDVISGEILDV